MEIKDSLRIEQIYFDQLKKNVAVLEAWKAGETDAKIGDILDACILADSAILLLYRNIGECYNELSAKISKEMDEIEELKKTADAYHDELNEKIDDVNNYIMSFVRYLEERVAYLEQHLVDLEDYTYAMDRVYVIDLVYDPEEDDYFIEYKGTRIGYNEVTTMLVDDADRYANVILRRVDDDLTHAYYHLKYDGVPIDDSITLVTFGVSENSVTEERISINEDDSISFTSTQFSANKIILNSHEMANKPICTSSNPTEEVGAGGYLSFTPTSPTSNISNDRWLATNAVSQVMSSSPLLNARFLRIDIELSSHQSTGIAVTDGEIRGYIIFTLRSQKAADSTLPADFLYEKQVILNVSIISDSTTGEYKFNDSPSLKRSLWLDFGASFSKQRSFAGINTNIYLYRYGELNAEVIGQFDFDHFRGINTSCHVISEGNY